MLLDELVILTSDQSCPDAISAPDHVFSSTGCCDAAAAFSVAFLCERDASV